MNESVGLMMKRIVQRLGAQAETSMREKGLTPAQAKALLCLLEESNASMTQRDLALRLGISHPAAQELIARLEAGGCLRCRILRQDRRRRVIELTDAAYALAGEMDASMRGKEEQLLRGLSAAEADALRRMLAAVYENASQGEQEDQQHGQKT